MKFFIKEIVAVVIAFLGYIFFISSNGYMVLLSWLLAICLYIYWYKEAKKKEAEKKAYEESPERISGAAELAALQAAAYATSPEGIAAAAELEKEKAAYIKAAGGKLPEDALLKEPPSP